MKEPNLALYDLKWLDSEKVGCFYADTNKPDIYDNRHRVITVKHINCTNELRFAMLKHR